MRVATLNLWARHGSWSERREVLIAGLRDLRPDLVAFQESVVTDHYDQVTDLLGAGYHVVHQEQGEADGTRASIASRWPLGEIRQTRLAVTPRVNLSEFAGWIGLVEVMAPEPLLFVNHKPSFRMGHELERELQAVQAARLVEETSTRRRTRPASASGVACSPWAERAWPTAMRGSGPTPMTRDIPSLRSIPS
jgi:hypothetical protein